MRRQRLRALSGALLLAACAACTPTHAASHRDTPTAGVKGLGDPLFPAMGNGGYLVSHYGITLSYQPKDNSLTGTTEITARTDRALSSFSLDFHGLDVRQATVNGAPATVTRKGDELRLTPGRPLDRDTGFTATVAYQGTPQTITDPDGSHEGWLRTTDGAVGLGEPNGSMAWFPGNHHPSDKATYDIAVSVPEGLTAVSNGELRGQRTADGRSTFQWHTGEPMASYLATVAIGKFQADQGAAGRVPQYVATDTAVAKKAADVPRWTGEITDWGSKVFGPYPFSSTGAIVGAGPEIDYALETQNRPYFNHPPDLNSVVHELSHQWFGDSVTPHNWQDMWLNEGFATYTEWLWDEQHGGPTTAQTFQKYYARDKNDELWSFPPAKPPTAKEISGSPVYGRAAMTLQKVREAVGDQTFFTILRTWLADHRFGNVQTGDFIALTRQVSGKDLSALFATWLYGSGKP